MRKAKKIISMMLVICMVMTLLPAIGGTANAAGTIHTVAHGEDLRAKLASADVKDGDILELVGRGDVNDTLSDAAPWVIDKAVTIRGNGGYVHLRAGGILLGADVTFEDITLAFGNSIRNAIIANGHTLTLKNVAQDSSSRKVHLLAGGLTGHTSSAKVGDHGKIIIQGTTSLGNIYAGSLSSDGKGNISNLPATIKVDSTASGRMGEVYASGALESPVCDNWFDFEEPAPPTPSADMFKVTGAVTFDFQLHNTVVTSVDGSTGGNTNADMVFTGGSYRNTSLKFANISDLSIVSGKLTPAAGSSFNADTTVSVTDGTELDLTNFADDLTIDNFTGGGALVLGQNQTLTINGNVNGETTVAVGSLFNEKSGIPTIGHIYISANNSTEDSFVLAPTNALVEVVLTRDTNGNWLVPSTEGDKIIIQDISMDDAELPIDNTGASMPLTVTYADSNLDFGVLYSVPLSILVNNATAIREGNEDDGFTYTANWGALTMEFGNNPDTYADELFIWGDGSNGKIPAGTYKITISVPKDYMESGKFYSFSATLTVSDDAIAPLQIPVPTANTSLKWTGQEQVGVSEGTGYTLTGHKGTDATSYIAQATLASGYQWNDGTNEVKSISWNISKADGPGAPTGLQGVAPSSAGGNDGQIIGTTPEMEYSTDSSFASKVDSGNTVTTGLTAGTYYVRMKETATHEAGAYAVVSVPAYNAPTVTTITVNSTGHKTDYTVGDSLDVSGLTIEVVMSNGVKNTVMVTENMVSGFDSSAETASQSLTIHYQGQVTTYTISIAAAVIPPAIIKHTVTVNDSYASVSGAGSYTVNDTVNISAGTRNGYDFAGWTASGVPLASPNDADTSFIMPAGDVTVTATWRLVNNNDSSNGDSSGDSSDSDSSGDSSSSGSTGDSSNGGSTGGSIGGGSVGGFVGGFVGGSSSGSSSDVSDETVSNDDGSTTTTTIDKETGTITETIKHTDGSSTTTETKNDGTVTTTEEDKQGNTTKTVVNTDGTTEITTQLVNGMNAVTTINEGGQQISTVTLSSDIVNEAVLLPIPEVSVTTHSGTAPTVNIILPQNSDGTKVEVPVADPSPGIVAILVKPDGTEKIIKHSIPTKGGLKVSLTGDATLKIVDNSKTFEDSTNHWASDAITFVTARGLFTGTSDDNFIPDTTTTRGMMFVVLARLADHDTSAHLGEAWHEPGVNWVIKNGISDGSNPDGHVSREELATMLWRYAGSPSSNDGIGHFNDHHDVSGYSQVALSWAVENGIINGKSEGVLDPKGNATRAEAVQMLMNYLNNI